MGKVCRIPDTISSFTSSGSAIKHLCGQGDLYVRLCTDVCSSKVQVNKEPSSQDDSVIIVDEGRSSHSKVVSPRRAP